MKDKRSLTLLVVPAVISWIKIIPRWTTLVDLGSTGNLEFVMSLTIMAMPVIFSIAALVGIISCFKKDKD